MAPGQTIPKQVWDFQAEVEVQTDSHPKNLCRVCEGNRFHHHQRVARVLLVIHDGLVYRLASFLVRWACGDCGTTFRNYPRGVLPYKRYVFIAVTVLCLGYLQEPSATYRSVVHSAGASKSLPVFHALPEVRADAPEREKELEDPKALSHVTVWRWMGPLAKLERGCGPRLERQLAGADRVDFSPWTIPQRKYRSLERLKILIRASQVLTALGLGGSPTDLGTMIAGP